jgi:hypothetical protein
MSQKFKLYEFYRDIRSSDKENIWQLVGLDARKDAGVFKKIKDSINTGHCAPQKDYWYDEEGNDIYHTRNPEERYYFFTIHNVKPLLSSTLEDKVEYILKMIKDYENNK